MAKILIVDDEPDAVELVAFNLKNAGFEVATAADGAAALKQARAPQRSKRRLLALQEVVAWRRLPSLNRASPREPSRDS